MEYNSDDIQITPPSTDITDADFIPSPDVHNWNVFGHSIPKQEVVFFSQVIILYIIIIVCLVEIILNQRVKDQCYKLQEDIWYSLLAGAIGYLLPNPSLNTNSMNKK
jgi:hypothetical protein